MRETGSIRKRVVADRHVGIIPRKWLLPTFLYSGWIRRPKGRRYTFTAKTPKAANTSASNASISGERVGAPVAAATTVAFAVDELFAAVVSLALLTVAVFMNVPGVIGAVIVSVMVAFPPFAIVPRPQVTVDVPLQVPCDGIADTSVVPAGMLSVTATEVADAGPAFDTVIV